MKTQTQSLIIVRSIALAVLFALVVAAFSSPAAAVPGENAVEVHYGDLDLTRDAGRETFDRRLRQAIRRVCQPGHTRSIRAGTETRQCILEKTKEFASIRAEIVAQAQSQATDRRFSLSQR